MKADRRLAVPTIDSEGFHIAEKDWYLLVRNIKSKVVCSKVNFPHFRFEKGTT